MVSVGDVPASSRFYQTVLDVTSGHGGEEFEMLMADGQLVMMLHQATVAHHHGVLHDPAVPNGNGVALWFDVADFDARVAAVREIGAELVHDVHVNPNTRHREIWLRDPDGYLVVLAEHWLDP